MTNHSHSRIRIIRLLEKLRCALEPFRLFKMELTVPWHAFPLLSEEAMKMIVELCDHLDAIDMQTTAKQIRRAVVTADKAVSDLLTLSIKNITLASANGDELRLSYENQHPAALALVLSRSQLMTSVREIDSLLIELSDSLAKDEQITYREAAKMYQQATGSKSGHQWFSRLARTNDPRLQLRPDKRLRRENVMCLIEAVLDERSKKRGPQTGGKYICSQCGCRFRRWTGRKTSLRICRECFVKTQDS